MNVVLPQDEKRCERTEKSKHDNKLPVVRKPLHEHMPKTTVNHMIISEVLSPEMPKGMSEALLAFCISI